jgi:hypothetical protein
VQAHRKVLGDALQLSKIERNLGESNERHVARSRGTVPKRHGILLDLRGQFVLMDETPL